MRSSGEELQPTSLRDVIAEMKSDINFFEREEKRLKEEREIASRRLKVAKWKLNGLKQKIFQVEERRDRLESKISEGERRTEVLVKLHRSNEERMNWIDERKKGVVSRSEEFYMKITHTKKCGQQIWTKLSGKLAERSQKHYHCSFLESKAENVKSRIASLEEHLGILKEKKELILKHNVAKRSSMLKNKAMIEQMEDDTKKSLERCSFANQQYLTMKLYKDNLIAETDNLREMRRDLDDQLRALLRARENRIINASYRAQFYR